MVAGRDACERQSFADRLACRLARAPAPKPRAQLPQTSACLSLLSFTANGDHTIWDDFMDAIEPLAARVPYMVATGVSRGIGTACASLHLLAHPCLLGCFPRFGSEHALAMSNPKNSKHELTSCTPPSPQKHEYGYTSGAASSLQPLISPAHAPQTVTPPTHTHRIMSTATPLAPPATPAAQSPSCQTGER